MARARTASPPRRGEPCRGATLAPCSRSRCAAGRRRWPRRQARLGRRARRCAWRRPRGSAATAPAARRIGRLRAPAGGNGNGSGDGRGDGPGGGGGLAGPDLRDVPGGGGGLGDTVRRRDRRRGRLSCTDLPKGRRYRSCRTCPRSVPKRARSRTVPSVPKVPVPNGARSPERSPSRSEGAGSERAGSQRAELPKAPGPGVPSVPTRPRRDRRRSPAPALAHRAARALQDPSARQRLQLQVVLQ